MHISIRPYSFYLSKWRVDGSLHKVMAETPKIKINYSQYRYSCLPKLVTFEPCKSPFTTLIVFSLQNTHWSQLQCLLPNSANYWRIHFAAGVLLGCDSNQNFCLHRAIAWISIWYHRFLVRLETATVTSRLSWVSAQSLALSLLRIA